MSAVFIGQAPARDAVAAAARLLDQLDTEERRHSQTLAAWQLIVDPRRVDIDSPELCPLGQVYGDFEDAALFADLDTDADWADVKLRAKVLGFWTIPTPGQEDDADDPGNAEWLNQRWREEIYDRCRVASPVWVLAA